MPGGRPAFVPTSGQRRLVEVLRANGVPMPVIASLLDVDIKTVRRHFRAELQTGKERVTAALGAVVVRAGLGGDWRASLAWLARYGGPDWRHVEKRVLSGDPDAPPIQFTDPNAMTAEEIRRELAELDRKEALLAEAERLGATLRKSNGAAH
jgi:hypothetical protein